MEDFFQLKIFNSLSIKSVTIYIPNESKIYAFNGNSNNSISANDGLPYYRMGGANYRPITLASIMSKIIEKVILTRIEFFCPQ